MINHFVLKSILLLGSALIFSANASDSANYSAESLRSAPRSEKIVDLPRQLPDAGQVLPLHEIAMVSRICANPKYRSQIGKSRDECSKAIFKARRECTKAFHDKFPRADNLEIDGRMSYQKFAAGYMRCLRDQYEAKRAD